jgi:hypothetical protein
VCIQCGANWSQQEMMLHDPQKAGEHAKVATNKPLATARNKR